MPLDGSGCGCGAGHVPEKWPSNNFPTERRKLTEKLRKTARRTLEMTKNEEKIYNQLVGPEPFLWVFLVMEVVVVVSLSFPQGRKISVWPKRERRTFTLLFRYYAPLKSCHLSFKLRREKNEQKLSKCGKGKL